MVCICQLYILSLPTCDLHHYATPSNINTNINTRHQHNMPWALGHAGVVCTFKMVDYSSQSSQSSDEDDEDADSAASSRAQPQGHSTAGAAQARAPRGFTLGMTWLVSEGNALQVGGTWIWIWI